MCTVNVGLAVLNNIAFVCIDDYISKQMILSKVEYSVFELKTKQKHKRDGSPHPPYFAKSFAKRGREHHFVSSLQSQGCVRIQGFVMFFKNEELVN